MARAGKSRETQGRRYLEALPRIFAKEAALVVVPSGASCEWTDQDDRFFAACEIEPCSQEWVRVTDAAGSGLGTYEEGARLIGVRSAKHFNSPRPFDHFVCPRCRNEKRWLAYYGGGWFCGKCTGLPYRSQAVGWRVSLWERRRFLERRLRGGKPPGMWNRTYEAELLELEQLHDETKGRSAWANSEYEFALTAKWAPLPVARVPEPPKAIPADGKKPHLVFNFESLIGPGLDGWRD